MPDEDFGSTVFADVDRQLSQQYEALRVFPVLHSSMSIEAH
jgi:hypothetical protein